MTKPSQQAVLAAISWLANFESGDSLIKRRSFDYVREHSRAGETVPEAVGRILAQEIDWLRDQVKQNSCEQPPAA